MARGTERFVDWLLKWRYALLAVGALVAVAAWFPAQRMRFDRSIENMFAEGDPVVVPYRRLKSQFGGNEVVLAVYDDPELLADDGRGIERLGKVSQRLKGVAGVKGTLSLAEISASLERLRADRKFRDFLGLGERNWKGPAILNPHDQVARAYRDLFEGYTHGSDGRTAAVVVMLMPQEVTAHGKERAAGEDSRRQTIEELRKIVEQLPDDLPPGVLAGEPVMVSEGFKLLEEDGRRLGWWSTALLGLVILVCFRSLRWLFVSIIVVQWTILVTQALLVMMRLELTMVSSMLTAIVTVVGVATVSHLIVHVRELQMEGQNSSPHKAFRTSLVLLFWPIVGAVLTDVAGFGSLWFASVGPVQDFGVMMAAGAGLVLAAVGLLVPALALGGAEGEPLPKPTWFEGQLDLGLERLMDQVQRRPWWTAAVSVMVLVVALIGSLRLEIETDFTRNFRPGSRVVSWYAFVESRLGGAGVWDVLVPVPNTLDAATLERVRNLERDLRRIRIPTSAGSPSLTKVISLVDVLDATQSDRRLAALRTELRIAGMLLAMPTFMQALEGRDENGQRWLRIMLRAKERQPAEQRRALINEVERLAKNAFPARDNQPAAEVTGFFVLLTKLIESLLRDQWTTFAISTGAIFLMLWVGFQRLSWALIGLIPNALPIYFVMGILGWLGLKINMGAAMIAAVSMGMSVDSSIHYFTAFGQARRAGKSVNESLHLVQKSVGRAMIVSTLAVIVGFLILCTSEFVPTIYFGALMGLSMLGGMAGNLIVLPLLLSATERRTSFQPVQKSGTG